MKRFGKQILCGVLAICLVSGLTTALATAYSSLYLDGYRATVTPQSNGKMAVTVDVTGRGPQAQIGATTIIIYESTDNELFYQVKTYNYEDYPEMMGSGTTYYKNPVTYSGTIGYYYFASVYCFAGDGTNGTERNYTTAVKQAVKNPGT